MIVYLVNGTVPRVLGIPLLGLPTWNKPDSPFSQCLVENAGRNCRVVEFSWDGKNTHAARLDGGRLLAARLKKEIACGSGPIMLVGHSHGGNVIMYALRELSEEELSTIHRVVTLGAPFMFAIPRDLTPFARALIWGVVPSLFLFFVALGLIIYLRTSNFALAAILAGPIPLAMLLYPVVGPVWSVSSLFLRLKARSLRRRHLLVRLALKLGILASALNPFGWLYGMVLLNTFWQPRFVRRLANKMKRRFGRRMRQAADRLQTCNDSRIDQIYVIAKQDEAGFWLRAVSIPMTVVMAAFDAGFIPNTAAMADLLFPTSLGGAIGSSFICFWVLALISVSAAFLTRRHTLAYGESLIQTLTLDVSVHQRPAGGLQSQVVELQLRSWLPHVAMTGSLDIAGKIGLWTHGPNGCEKSLGTTETMAQNDSNSA